MLAHARLLEQFGPQLGRPRVDTLKGSRHANMKELRFDADDGVWRLAFAFDPKRKAILLVADDRSVDDGGLGARIAPDEGDVFLRDGAALELPRKRELRDVVLGDDHHAAGVLVEAMHDPRPQVAAHPAQIAHLVEQAVHDGRTFAASAGMHREAGGLSITSNSGSS